MQPAFWYIQINLLSLNEEDLYEKNTYYSYYNNELFTFLCLCDLPEGEIKKKLIYEILPFDNSIMVLKLKGSQVKELFDYIATIPNGAGAFPQVSKGVSYTINYAAKECENILINEQTIDPVRIYTIATNSYMASGGDGYAVFKGAMDRYDTSVFQRDVFIDYIIHLGGTITPEPDMRIQLKNLEALLWFLSVIRDAA